MDSWPYRNPSPQYGGPCRLRVSAPPFNFGSLLTPVYDLKNFHRSLISIPWHKFFIIWSSNRLGAIKKKQCPGLPRSYFSRHWETIFSHLRVGHTNLTHSYLFLRLTFSLSYQYCETDEPFVQYFFSCPPCSIQSTRIDHRLRKFISIFIAELIVIYANLSYFTFLTLNTYFHLILSRLFLQYRNPIQQSYRSIQPHTFLHSIIHLNKSIFPSGCQAMSNSRVIHNEVDFAT